MGEKGGRFRRMYDNRGKTLFSFGILLLGIGNINDFTPILLQNTTISPEYLFAATLLFRKREFAPAASFAYKGNDKDRKC